jgi:hypothetical protein
MKRRLLKRLQDVLIAVAVLGAYAAGYGLLLSVLYGALAGGYPGSGLHCLH